MLATNQRAPRSKYKVLDSMAGVSFQMGVMPSHRSLRTKGVSLAKRKEVKKEKVFHAIKVISKGKEIQKVMLHESHSGVLFGGTGDRNREILQLT